jgi:formylglycine-generating enzyme required for sulfatase activity/DNA-binding winged helix-turn-helix (wHTH) protein
VSSSALPPSRRYRFDAFEFRERTGELWRCQEDLHLPDQAAKVLLALLQTPGDLVTREELRQVLWPDKVSGDFEGGINSAVNKLRRVLDDDGAEPRLIGTLPRRGYRLLVPVAVLEEPEVLFPAAPPGPAPVSERRLWRSGRASVAVLAVTLLGGGLLFWQDLGQRSRKVVVVDLPGGQALRLVHIPPGEFVMGVDEGFRRTEPLHRVTLTQGCWMGATEVTQAQWRAVMGNDPSFFHGDDKPVEQVSWDDGQAFCQRLGALDPGRVYRLPTEAEWECAARAGRVRGHSDDPDASGWHPRNSLAQTHPVARKQANPWGLFDMVGNVWEWCADGYGPYSTSPQTDPQAPPAELRTARGGSWRSPGKGKGMVENATSTARVTLRYGWTQDYAASDLGFRVVAVLRVP